MQLLHDLGMVALGFVIGCAFSFALLVHVVRVEESERKEVPAREPGETYQRVIAGRARTVQVYKPGDC